MQQAKQTIGRNLLALIEQSRKPGEPSAQLEQVRTLIAALPDNKASKDQKNEVLQLLVPARTLEQARSILAHIPAGNPVRDAVEPVLAALSVQSESAFVELNAIRKGVEGWYDDSMDRVSGIYKRRVHTWLLLIALLLTMFIGADSFRIARMLADSASLRALVVAQASSGTTASNQNSTQARAGSSDGTSPSSSGALDQLRQLENLFGYDEPLLVTEPHWWQTGHWWPFTDPDASVEWARFGIKFAGLLVSAFAISLGAPFWFDLLQKVANLRASGTRPEDRKKAEQAGA